MSTRNLTSISELLRLGPANLSGVLYYSIFMYTILKKTATYLILAVLIKYFRSLFNMFVFIGSRNKIEDKCMYQRRTHMLYLEYQI